MNRFFGRKTTTSSHTQRAFSKLMMTSALVAAGTIAISTSAHADGSWANLTQTGGSTFTTNTPTANITDIKVTSANGKAIGTGNADIKAGDTVNVDAKLFVVRDNRPDTASLVDGRLNSTGKVIIIDGNGVMFGKNSVIDVGSIVATTGDATNKQLLGNADVPLQFTNFGTGTVSNEGSIKASGLVAFVAPTVKNSGTISANLGRVSLAAGKSSATVDLYGDGLVEFSTAAVADEGSKLLSENTGSITAQKIQMSAASAKNLVDSIVNMEGVLNATSAVKTSKGQIILSADKVVVGKPTTKAVNSVTGDDVKIYAKSVDLGLTIKGAVSGSAKEVNVLSDAAKIAQGLDVISTGGTINVAAGTYNEHLVVSKSGVTLNGAKAGISGPGSTRGTGETIIVPNSPGVTVTGSNVTIDGFTFAGATGADGYGIYVNGASGAVLQNNIINGVSQYGIFLNHAANANVSTNLILNTGNHGIYALESDNVKILANQVGVKKGSTHNINGDGIQLSSSNNAYIYNNRIADTTSTAEDIGNGIQLINSDNVTLRQNTIYNVDWDGIRITKSENANVFDNDIHHAVRVGVYSTLSSNINIYNNLIDNTTLRGIELHNMLGSSLVKGNTINASASDGIWVRNSDDVTLDGNKIGYGLDGLFKTADDSTIAGYGILVTDSDNTLMTSNSIAHTGKSGIYASNATNLQIGAYTAKNIINYTGAHGIHVVNSAGAKIVANQIGIMKAGSNNINGDGILVEDSNGVIVDRNRIAKTTSTATGIGSGIHIKNSDNAYVFSNTAYETAWDGIRITGGTGVTVDRNDIDNVKQNGIFAQTTSDLTITNNDVNITGMSGVMIQKISGTSVISNNFINKTTLDGINLLLADDVTIQGNLIGYGIDKVLSADDTFSGRDGIHVAQSGNVSITGNKIVNSKLNGVHIIDGDGLITLSANLINNSSINGILAETTSVIPSDDEVELLLVGSPLNLIIFNNLVSNSAAVQGFAAVNLDIGADVTATLAGNTLGNNFTNGLAAYSGVIDLTGATNTIQNTETGLYFYPADPSTLSLVGDTIGTTAFIDQTNLFIDLGVGALFAPGSPTILNGNDATYTLGGVTIAPSTTGNIVSDFDYAVLEAFINDYNDTNDRGLFFFAVPGTVSTSFLIDPKDILRNVSLPSTSASRGSLVITGLPSVGGVAGGAGAAAGAAFNPAAIEPAAGDEAGNEGATAGNVANIQPAAGGSEAGCWADATASLGQGSAVTFNFGSAGAALLQGAANCGSGQAAGAQAL